VGQIADHWGNDYFDDIYHHNAEPKQYEGYCTDVFFNQSIRFIKAKKDKPFFIYLAPNITHLPLRVAEKYSQPHVEKGIDEKLAVLYGMIDSLDENIGRLMACLKKEGIDENTIILFTTDDGAQGAAISRTPKYWNTGMRGKKGSKEEGGHRVFSFFRWPAGNIGAGTDNNTLISVMDVYPTLLELCGLERPAGTEFTGRSFKPYLAKPLDPEMDDRMFFFYCFTPGRLDDRSDACVIWKNWRLLGGRKLVKDFAIETVRISIAGQTVEKAVAPEDTRARFTLELEAGDADLETALIGDGKDGVAYFVTVQYNGP
jgi:hypothetical protein